MRNGVVHVGAHKGEEVPRYLKEQRIPIICFEPQELEWPHDHPWVKLERVALGDDTGRLLLHVSERINPLEGHDTPSASGLRLNHEIAHTIGWTPTPAHLITVPIMRFDEWVEGHEGEVALCSLLVIDVQGMELQVLKGFGRWLWYFDKVVVECSDTPVYEGGSKARDIVVYLSTYGLQQVTPIVSHGDVTFTR